MVLKNLECIHKGYLFVKLDFEIAVDQQTRNGDRTFEGVPDPNRPPVPAGRHAHIWSQLGKFWPNPLNMSNPDWIKND